MYEYVNMRISRLRKYNKHSVIKLLLSSLNSLQVVPMNMLISNVQLRIDYCDERLVYIS